MNKKLNSLLVLLLGLLVFSFAPQNQAAAAPPAQGDAEWLVMIYQVADDNTLEEDILIDFNEAEMVGSTAEVQIVAQVDRFEGGFDDMGGWTSTKRFNLTKDGDLKEIASEELEDLGETNMADGDTLVDFITWAVTNYPARKYALIMSDHGLGWPGGFGDPDPGIPGADDVVLVNVFGHDFLWLMEIDRALEQAREQTGIELFDIITLDVCLMGQLEVFNALAPHTKYAVASEEVVPGVGMAYADFLGALTENPSMEGADLAIQTVTGFLTEDKRLLDPDFSGGASAKELGEALLFDSTITAIDSAEIPNINAALDEFTTVLANIDPNQIAEARAYSQSYAAPFGEEFPPSYIDLGHFVQLITELSGDASVATAGEALTAAMTQATIGEKHGEGRPGSTGLAIYFPTPDLYALADNLQYSLIASRFAEATQWDEFLASQSGSGASAPQPRPKSESEPIPLPKNVTEAELEEAVATIAYYVDQEGQALKDIPDLLANDGFSAPVITFMQDQGMFKEGRSGRAALIGPKPIQVDPLIISSNVVSSTEPLTVTTAIAGERLAYVYQFVGRYLPKQNILVYEDMDYITSEADKTIGGVTYPDWGEGNIPLQVEWSPTVYAVSDGTTSVRALFEPEKYGATPTYALQGTYHFKDGSPAQFAKILFRDANEDGVIEMNQVMGYSGDVLTNSVGAPRQISYKVGDSFTILQIGEDASTGEAYREPGETITLTQKSLFIESTPAPSGNYVFGIIAEDIDGNNHDQYQDVFVYNPDAAAVDGFVPYINSEIGFALLHPEKWTVEANADGVFFTSDEITPSFTFITSGSYTTTAAPAETNEQAIQDVTSVLDLEGLEFTTDITDSYIGLFDGKSQQFSYEIEGELYYGEVIATTPKAGTTYAVLITAPDAIYDAVWEDSFGPLTASFDMFVLGHEQPKIGAEVPTFATTTFKDDFSKATSGLVVDETMQEWGRGYYAKTGHYVYAMNFAPNYPIYDYYADETLADKFMLQATASYTGSTNNGYGLIFQVTRPATATDETPDQFYTFRISGDGFYMVEKMGETPMDLIEWTDSSLIDQTEGATNTLTVTGNNGTYNLDINGQQVDSFTDTDYSDGSFGLIAENYDDKKLANFTFDDLQVGTAK